MGNTGNADATQVAVTDQLPAGIDFVSATGGGSFDTNTRKVTWSIASLATGATQSFDLVVSVQ